jgi:hypothetical protein
MNAPGTTSSCCCNADGQQPKADSTYGKIRKTSRSLPSIATGILIAFFPKCPMCWAVYMSMFGSLGLTPLPYMPWLLPVLLVFLALHLFMLLRKAIQRHYFFPFWISLAGAVLIMTCRTFVPQEKWLLFTGMVFIISGSLMNSFSGHIRIPFHLFKKTI